MPQGPPYTALCLSLFKYFINFKYRPDFIQAKFSCGTKVYKVNGFEISCSLTEYGAMCFSRKKIDVNDFGFKLNS